MCCEPDWVTALKLPDPCPHMTAPSHTSYRQSAGRREIIHTVSQREVGVLCQPERFAACLLSPAIEVIHRAIMLQVIVQKNTAACCTSTSTSTSFPCHSWIIPPESQHQPHTQCTGGEECRGVVKFLFTTHKKLLAEEWFYQCWTGMF